VLQGHATCGVAGEGGVNSTDMHIWDALFSVRGGRRLQARGMCEAAPRQLSGCLVVGRAGVETARKRKGRGGITPAGVAAMHQESLSSVLKSRVRGALDSARDARGCDTTGAMADAAGERRCGESQWDGGVWRARVWHMGVCRVGV
jgi:hypothetical protein